MFYPSCHDWMNKCKIFKMVHTKKEIHRTCLQFILQYIIFIQFLYMMIYMSFFFRLKKVFSSIFFIN